MARGYGDNTTHAPRATSRAQQAERRPSTRFHADDLRHLPEERLLVEALARKAARCSGISLSEHARQACAEDHLRPLSHQEVYAAIREGKVIEVNDGSGQDCRLLLRKGGVCVVLSLGTRTVVTAWWNDPRDDHSSLDLSAYHRPLKSEGSRRYLHKLIRRGVRMVQD